MIKSYSNHLEQVSVLPFIINLPQIFLQHYLLTIEDITPFAKTMLTFATTLITVILSLKYFSSLEANYSFCQEQGNSHIYCSSNKRCFKSLNVCSIKHEQ